ncbi:MAG: hypothetical protein ACFFE8_02555 [Candidatus Heimdallarchaeota archaeon]
MPCESQPSQKLGVVAQILKKLEALREDAAITVQELKALVNANMSWSLFLCGLAYLSEIKAIHIGDSGVVDRIAPEPIFIPPDAETKIQENVAKYKISQKEKYRVI